MADQENGESQTGTPQAFLNSVVGQPVWVRLNSGIDYKGINSTAYKMLTSRFIDVFGWVHECRS
jgi:hypothetical protein